MSLVYDPRRAEIQADPYPAFRRLRDEDPCHWSEVLGGWVLTRYEDVKLAISDRRLSADRVRPFFQQLSPEAQAAYAPLADSISRWAVFHDPPDHTRLRGLLNKAFTARAVADLAPRIRDIIAELLDAATRPGAMDLIADFAYPLPASVILEMLGLPRSDLDPIKHWSDELALFVGSAVNTPDKYARATASIQDMNAYFAAAIARRRREPGPDLLSAMIAARDQGDFLSEEELMAACVLLVFAGHETTTNLLGNGLLALVRHPGARECLRRQPELLPAAVEELLRYDGPAATAVRIAREDLSFHGRTIRRGDRVFALMNAANRDERQFPHPDELDFHRGENRHLAFGQGIHFCLGAPLARLEAQLALAALLERCGDWSLGDEPIEWSNSLVLRGVRRLPLRRP